MCPLMLWNKELHLPPTRLRDIIIACRFEDDRSIKIDDKYTASTFGRPEDGYNTVDILC